MTVQLPRWIVEVTATKHYEVEVEAEDWSRARNAACLVPVPDMDSEIDASPKTQLGEPWVYSYGWYLDGQSGRLSRIVVFERAYGQVFTQSDVDVLATRLVEIGLVIESQWNGKGCGSVSFQCAGRVGKNT